MKRTIIILSIFLGSIFCNAQQNEASISMQAGYIDRVFYDFSEGESISFNNDEWDIAFLSNSAMSIGVRVNSAKGIQVYEASNNIDDWESLDPSGIDDSEQLYNSDTAWTSGAFDQGSATYGWGEYNMETHIVEGTVLFFLKYIDETVKKFWIENFQNGYTFTYATWDPETETWMNEESHTLSNNSTPDRIFNYYNLDSNSEIIAEPKAGKWDIVFHQYYTEVQPGMPYLVTGVFQNPNYTVAQSTQENASDYPNGLNYEENVNTIGYDWKSFGGSGYTLDNDRYYYLKNEAEDTIYQLHFTGFEGSSTGNVTFNYNNVTPALNTITFDSAQDFSLYPNPAINGNTTILMRNYQTSSKAHIQVFDLLGKKVYETQVLPNKGSYEKKLNLSGLERGTYLIRLNTNGAVQTKKLILN